MYIESERRERERARERGGERVIYVYIYNMYQQDLALDSPEGLICHKTQPTNQETYKSNYSPSSYG